MFFLKLYKTQTTFSKTVPYKGVRHQYAVAFLFNFGTQVSKLINRGHVWFRRSIFLKHKIINLLLKS